MIELIGFIAAAVGAWISLPQAIRAVRHGTAGVSPATFQLLGAVGAMWLIYGVARDYVPAIPSNFIQLGACCVVLVQCLRQKNLRLLDAFGTGGASVLLGIVVLMSAGTSWFGWYVVVITIGLRLPQLRAAAASPDVSGISTATWTAAVCSNALWCVYGIAHHDVVLVTCTALAVATSLAILLIVGYRRRAAAYVAMGTEVA